MKICGTEVLRVPLILDYLAGSKARDRIQQARSPRGIAREIRIAHTLAVPV
jgi:hypothetical protein